MTTIVADSTQLCMASDSRISHLDSFFKSPKIFELAGGELIGIAGDITDGVKFAQWYSSGCDKEDEPEFGPEGFDALVLDKSGKLTIWARDLIGLEVQEPFYSIGSGAKAALGALHMGATPAQAVLVAAKIDSNTDSNVVEKFIKKGFDRSSENGWD